MKDGNVELNQGKNKNVPKVSPDSKEEILELEDVEIKDVKLDLSVDPNAGKNGEVKLDGEQLDTTSQAGVSTPAKLDDSSNGVKVNEENTSLQEPDSQKVPSTETNSVDEVPSSDINTTDSTTNGDSSLQTPMDDDVYDNYSETYDDRSLKEKINDTKDNLKQTKENIENMPDRIRDKKDEIKQKASDTKDKIKQMPENVRQKGEEIKDKAQKAKESLQNIPKSKDELKDAFKNRLQNSAQNAKNRMRNAANNAAEKGKENLRNRVENSKPVQTAKKAKNAYDKTKKAAKTTKKVAKATAKATKAAANAAANAAKGLGELIVSTMPWSLIVIAVVAVVALIIILVVGATPGKDDVKDSYQAEFYSERDLKTLDKLKNLYEKYPSSDPALAMVTVVYPYYETLQDSEVTRYINTDNDDWDPSKTYEDYEDIDDYEDAEESEDEESCDGDDCDTEVGDDMYLEKFRKWSYRRKFKKLLKKSESMTETEFEEYLKDNYFKKERGYKYLFSFVPDDKQDEFAEAIIEDLKQKKNYFINYIYENKTCVSDLQSAGTIEVEDMLKGNILVDVKVSSCTTGKNVWGCESMYSAPIPMEKYIKGVAYEEIGVDGSSDIEKVKAQIVAAKSYVIGRAKGMGWGIKQDSAGNYVVTIRANTNDQDYCDIDVGCSSGKTVVRGSSNKRSAVDEATRAKLDEAWEKTKDVYIYSSKSKTTAGEFCQSRSGRCSFCHKGTCLAHQELAQYRGTDYSSILADQYSSYQILTIENGIANVSIPSDVNCEGSNNDGACGIPGNKFIYYNQGNYHDEFCGREGRTIASSGCGVTSMAMVIANIGDNEKMTPVDTMKEAYAGGHCGTGIDGTRGATYFPEAAKKHGLTIKTLTRDSKGVQDAVSILQNGGLIIVSNNSSSPFTTGAHFIVIRSIAEDGKTVKVADPAHSGLFNKSYDINDWVNKGWINSGWYGFTSAKSQEIVKNYCSPAGDTNGMFATNTRRKGQHTGQCIVYVEKRAAEVIDSAKVGYENISNRSRYKTIWTEGGFGCAKCAFKKPCSCPYGGRSKKSDMEKLFKTSTDYTKPQAGAVIVWDGGSSSSAGHVALIEKVNEDGTVMISQSNWCSGSCELYSYDKLTLNQIKNYGGNHPFLGYIYLLQPK